MSKITLYMKVARSQILVMPIVLMACAMFYARYRYGGGGSVLAFACVCVAVLSFNIAVNMISEYRDCEKGVDDVHSPNTRYRLVSGIVPKAMVLKVGVYAFLFGAVSGICSVIILQNWMLVVPGIAAAVIVLGYSESPLGLKYKALGEVCVFLTYGPILFSACIIALSNQVDIRDIVFSIPFGLMTANVVLANNIRDYEFEKGKTVTFPIKFGLKAAFVLLYTSLHLSFLCVLVFIHLGWIPLASCIVMLAYPLVFLSFKRIGRVDFISVFGILQVAFGLLIFLSFLI